MTGAVAERLQPGIGLTGMRERFAQFGGEVEVTTNAGRGFALQAFVPTADDAGMIRILLVDDQLLVRRGIKSLLELAETWSSSRMSARPMKVWPPFASTIPMSCYLTFGCRARTASSSCANCGQATSCHRLFC